MARLSQIIRNEHYAQMKNDRRLSYLGPNEEEQEALEGTYDEATFIKEAKNNPRQLFDFVYRRQMNLIEALDHNEKEYEALSQEYEKMAEEDNALRTNYNTLQDKYA